MNYKKGLTMVITSALALSVSIPMVSASAQTDTSTTQKTVSTKATTKAKADQLTAEQQKRLVSIAGFDNAKQFTSFYTNLRRAVANNDKEAVAKRISYPLSVHSDNSKKKILNEKQFIAEYDTIITAKVKKALAEQRLDDLFINYQGVMVGNGDIWIAILNHKLGVFTINHM